MKVEMGFFKCMESMVRDLRHPYIPSTTVLGDNPSHFVYMRLLLKGPPLAPADLCCEGGPEKGPL